MVTDPMVASLFQTGEELIRRLDSSHVPIQAAFWLWDEESKRWRLFIASPLVATEGPLAVYRILQEHLTAGGPFTLQDISVVSPNNRFVSLFRSALHTGPADLEGIRFTGNTIKSVFIDDAYVYRAS